MGTPEDAVDYARAAVEFDRACKYDAAIFYYRCAADALARVNEDGLPMAPDWKLKQKSYMDRMLLLMQTRKLQVVFTGRESRFNFLFWYRRRF